MKRQLDAHDKEAAIREMAILLAATGKVADVEELVRTAAARGAGHDRARRGDRYSAC